MLLFPPSYTALLLPEAILGKRWGKLHILMMLKEPKAPSRSAGKHHREEGRGLKGF